MSSEREQIQERIYQWLLASNAFDAPYGVLKGHSTNGRARQVTFGRSNILDATVDVYGPRFMLLRWRAAIRKLPSDGQLKFADATAMLNWIKENMI